MSTVLETDAWYWLPDEERYMVPAKLLSYSGGSAKFELENGPELIQRVKTDLKLDPLDPQCLDSNISNLIELNSLTEKAVLHVLRIRFLKDDIYTLVSGILIACNPFKSIPIYDKDTMDTYRNNRDHSTLPPHIFSLANEAYVSMVQTGTPQSVIISGESGAGKTESIKLILKYLARLSEITCTSSKSVQDQILSANPLLEAFGNAKTSRNNNSSRFGKLITVNFSGGVINQASIISYLLEKSRVVHQQTGERNFHIFYQLIASCAADEQYCHNIGLQQSVDECSYLSDPDSSYLYNMDEVECFSEVEKSMEILGINSNQRQQIFQVVACVLRLGNLQFSAADSVDARAIIDDQTELEGICETLGISNAEMRRLLVSRNFGVRSIVTCFFSVQQAKETRDAFSKALYSYLFSWLIKMINLTLKQGNRAVAATGQFIALLDIFGFENFESNSFEQILINYCNEKLQFHFNSHIFVMEQEAYRQEGIDIDYINFKDNSATLAVLEMKVTGILSMIDEENNVPKGSDLSLLNKILNSQDKKALVSQAKPAARVKGQSSQKSSPMSHLSSFVVKHYAGEVAYDVTGFLQKNKDALSPDLMYVGKNSTNSFVAELFKDFENMTKATAAASTNSSKSKFVKRTGAQSKGPSISTQFKKQLADLITTLNSTSSFFVRCMKSNPDKEGGVFDCQFVMRQLQYSGLLQVCRIRQDGYPCQFDFQGFHCMYRKLNHSSTTGPLLAKDLETNGLYGPDDYRIGKSKIFLKYNAGQKLEQLRGETINDAARICQSTTMKFLAKMRLKKLLHAYRTLDSMVEAKDKDAVESALSLIATSIPDEGSHLPSVNAARTSLARMNEEEPVLQSLSEALQRKDFSAMEVALASARSLSPPLVSPLVTECELAIKAYLKARMDAMSESFGGMTSAKQATKSKSSQRSNAPRAVETKNTLEVETSHSSATSPSRRPSATNNIPFANKLNPTSQSPRTESTSPPPSPWGSPSAIRAANKQMANNFPNPSCTPQSETLSHMAVNEKEVVVAPPPPPFVEEKSNDNGTEKKNEKDNSSVDTEVEVIVDPSEDFKTRKKSILTRRLSSEQIGIAAEVHHMIEVLHDLCMCEVGINPDDIKPLELVLKKINFRDCEVSREVAEMMMAEQELIRAKKQLLLQAAVDKVKPTTPLWKLKNLAHQSRQIGMENYHGCRNLEKIIEAAS